MVDELSQKEIENLILLLLSTSKQKKLSHLHIQKEMFLLRDVAEFLKIPFKFLNPSISTGLKLAYLSLSTYSQLSLSVDGLFAIIL